MYEDLFTTYDMVEPPKIYKDNPDLAIRDIQRDDSTPYIPGSTDIQSSNIPDYPGVVSPATTQKEQEAKEVKKEENKETKQTKAPKTTNKGKFSNRDEFVTTLTNTYKQVLSEKGLDPNYAYILTASAVLESAWGSKISGSYNYGGVKGKTGTVKSTIDYVNGQYVRRNQTFRDFSSVKDYCSYVVSLLGNKRYNAFNTYSASKPFQFWRHVLDAGYGGGDAAGKNSYMNSVSKIYSIVKKTVV